MAKRRKLPNGTGSIERVLKSPQGKTRLKQYRARLPAKYDSMGKKIQKDIGFFKTYNEALDALLNYKAPAPAITFKELYYKFKDTNKFKNLTQKTKDRYDNAFSKFATIHDYNISEILFTDLQEVLDTMEEDGYYKKVKGKLKRYDYSRDSIDRLRTVAKKIFDTAVKNNIINYNLAESLDVGGKGIRRKKEIFTQDEIESLYQSIPKNPNAMHVLVLIFTGMRPGEYRELTKNKIDLDKNTIEDFGEKTEAGKTRKMFIHPKIKEIIKYLMDKSETGYLLESNVLKLGNVSETTFNKKIYYPALERAGVKKKIPYSCRYTFATIAHNSGVDDKALQRLMGHTNFQVTANSYIQDLDKYIFTELQKIK